MSFFDLVSYLQEMDIWQVSYAQLQMYKKLKYFLKKDLLSDTQYTMKFFRKHEKTTDTLTGM